MEKNLNNGTSVLLYNGTNITFELKEKDVMVNLTEMAKAFGKKPHDFLRLPSTQKLIAAIEKKFNSAESHTDSTNTGKSLIIDNQIITTLRGGGATGMSQGTWGNRLIALSFAQWLSVDFHLLCLEKIEELLTNGVATVSNDDEAILHAINILQKRLDEKSKKLEIAENAILKKDVEIEKMSPKAKYTDEVLMSETTYTMTQVAKEFGMGASAFSDFLFKKKVIFRLSGMWMMFAKYDDKGYSAVRTKKIESGHGSIITSSYLVWTEKGRMFLHNKFDKELNVDPQLNMFA